MAMSDVARRVVNSSPSAGTASPGAVLLVSHYAARYTGNFIPSQLAVAECTKRRLGLETVLVLPAETKEHRWVAGIDPSAMGVEFLPPDFRRRPGALVDLARRFRAQILHSHFVALDLEAWYAARRTGSAVIWHLHNGLLGYRLEHRLRDLLKVRVLGRSCDLVLACSDATYRDALRRGFRADHTDIVLNGVALDRLDHPHFSRHAFRDQLGIDDQAFVVLAFGTPPSRKGVDVLVDAMARLHTRAGVGRRLAVVIVGGDDIGAFVRQRLGTIPPWLVRLEPVADVASLFHGADVFVSASREEGFPVAVGEAMACGLPVVGTDIPGTAHYWSAPGYFRYPVENCDALAARVHALMRSPELAWSGARNRDWAQDRLGIDRYAERTVDLYERLLGPTIGLPTRAAPAGTGV
jgi:glycosyltransferase involved in cell wall biosynthesis